MTSIHVSLAAARQIRLEIDKRGGGIGLRVGLKPVGCSGYAYTYELADVQRTNEQRFYSNDASLLVASADLPGLEGACLDFVSDGFVQGFRFDNPNVRNTCGCGESFSLRTDGRRGGAA